MGDDWGQRGSNRNQSLPLEILLFHGVHTTNKLSNALSNNRCKASGNWNEGLPLEVFRKSLKVLELSTVDKSRDALSNSGSQSSGDGEKST